MFTPIDTFNTDRILRLLKKATPLLSGDAKDANYTVIMQHRDPNYFFRVLSNLNQVRLLENLSQVSFDILSKLEDLKNLNIALQTLKEANLLGGDVAGLNFNMVMNNSSPRSMAKILILISNNTNLFTVTEAEVNRDAIVNHPNTNNLYIVLSGLYEANLLVGPNMQENFNAVISTYQAIFCNNLVIEHLQRVPSRQFTQERFDEILNICRLNAEDEAINLIVDYIDNGILLYVPPYLPLAAPNAEVLGQRFNTSQSTHIASVHDSVSKSAANLWQRYMNEDLETARREFANWLTQASNFDPLKIAAANRCFLRITSRSYHFVDSQSRVSTEDLLALLWIGIHDKENMFGSIEDGHLALIEGLYECQRGYNLSELGEDDGAAADASICVAGTFNKLLEKMVGRLQDVEVIYLTMAGFSFKLPKVVRDEAVDYLQRLPFAKREHLLAEIASKSNTVKPIWSEIKEVVQARMLDEFGSLFVGDKEPLFLEYIEYCEHTEFMEKDLIELRGVEDRAESVAVNSMFRISPVAESSDEDDKYNGHTMASSSNAI